MKMIWHIMKKDLRAIWPLWLAWMGLIAVRIFLVVYFLYYAGEPSLRWLGGVGAFSFIADALLILSLVRSLVHMDVLVGDRAFWLTRPIARWQLLFAKVLGVLVVCGLSPLVLLVPAWLSFGFSGEEILRGVLYQGVYSGMASVGGFGLAVVTRKSGAFWLWLVGFVVATVVVCIAVQEGFGLKRSFDEFDSLFAVAVSAAVIGLGVVWRFFGRQAIVSWVCVIVGVGPLLIAVPFIDDRMDLCEFGLGAAMPVGIQVRDDYVRVLDKLSKNSSEHMLELSLMVPRSEKYSRVESRFSGGSWTNPGDDAIAATLAIKVPQLWDWRASRDQSVHCFNYQFDAEWLAKELAGLQQLRFTGKFELRFFQEVVLMDVDVCSGLTVSRGSRSVRFLSFGKEAESVGVRFVTAQALSNRKVRWKFLHQGGEELRYGRDRRGQAVLLGVQIESYDLMPWSINDALRIYGSSSTGRLRFVLHEDRLVGDNVSELKAEQLKITKE